MDFFEFANSDRAIWFVLVLFITVLTAVMQFSQRKRLSRFVSQEMQDRLVRRSSTGTKVLRIGCIAISGCAFVLALMQPQIVQQEKHLVAQDSANVFVALDVSKSMLATDVAPNRLERAKSEIRDMLPSLLAHRLGLIAFSGRASILSPLTTDHGFFRLVLDSASPESVNLGGTNIGEVIEKSTKLLAANEGPKVLILITDGEDHDDYAVKAADRARQAGVVIIPIGFGSPTGTTIDYVDRKTGQKKRVQDSSGRDVVSKLNESLLTEIAHTTKGVYIPARNGVLDIEDILTKTILPLMETKEELQVDEQRTDLFQWCVLLGLLFFTAALLLEGRRTSRRKLEKTA